MSLSNKFDSNIYIEPDGSSWVRIFHHNNPQTYGVFVHHSDSEWDAGIYGTENKWFDLGILNDISGIWESEKRYAKTKGMIPETGASCMGHDGKHGEMKQNGRDE